MFQLFYILIIAIFVAMLFVNLFFRVKIFKVYKYLVQNKVEFSVSQFLNETRMEAEVISRYPQHEEQIRRFVSLIKRSVQLASVLVLLILALGYLLMKFR